MPQYPITIKHAGRVHSLTLDTDQPATAFKEAIYAVTGVPVDRMKVMVKGGVLKDDHDWFKVGVKENQNFMVIGAAGPLPQAPEKKTVFLEDMDEADLASALALPVGFKNLGNTCYMNATAQALRAIPELQTALGDPSSGGPTLAPLPSAMRALYSNMGRTTEAVVPIQFLQTLRSVAPQFAEQDRSRNSKGSAPSAGLGGMAAMMGMGGGYAQQDAEECWTAIVNGIKDVPGLPAAAGVENPVSKTFVEQYMMGEVLRELKCDEAPEEPPTVTSESVLKIECNIGITTNFMQSGIMDAMDQKLEKTSPSLGREAVYTQHSRLSRLPSYLTVHMVRFAWRRDIGKKAKIMRKVKFPNEYDALDLVTPDLKEQLLPVSTRLRELERDRAERRKVRRRTKNVASSSTASAPAPAQDVEMADVEAAEEAKKKEAVDLEPEEVYRKRELEELEKLVSPALKSDTGCSVSGLYELVAIVTHKGAAADAGHYIGFVKRSVFHPTSPAGVDTKGALDEDEDDWYKFDDDKVTVFPKEKLTTLDGGGEDASAYVLLYRTKSLA